MTAPAGTDPHRVAPGVADDARAAVARRLTPALLRIGRRIRPASGDLAVGHFSTLATLHRCGPQRPSDLARIERFAPPAVTRIVGALEERGLVVRRPSPDDARSTLVEITEEGRRLLVATRTEQAHGIAALLEVLDDDELATLAGALDALEKVAGEASAVLVEPAL
jgi:DNA-binding MarR family transcriptional regulator